MIRQYYAQRHRRAKGNPGTIDVGTIIYIADRGARQMLRLVNPWIVEAWLPRAYHPAVAGRPATTYMAGGHLALVRSLRNGQRRTVSDALLRSSMDDD